MSNGMIWLAGFLMGGITAFVVLAVPMRQRYWELTLRWQKERARRIEAEDNGRHTNDALRAVSSHEWGGPLSDLGISGNEPIRPQSGAAAPGIDVDGHGNIVLPTPYFESHVVGTDTNGLPMVKPVMRDGGADLRPTVFIDEDDWREYE